MAIDLSGIRLCNSTTLSQAYFKAYDNVVLALIAWACKATCLNQTSVFSVVFALVVVLKIWHKEVLPLLWFFNSLVSRQPTSQSTNQLTERYLSWSVISLVQILSTLCNFSCTEKVQETLRTCLLMLARHKGMSVPAALGGLAICPCATWALIAHMYLCVVFDWESVIY